MHANGHQGHLSMALGLCGERHGGETFVRPVPIKIEPKAIAHVKRRDVQALGSADDRSARRDQGLEVGQEGARGLDGDAVPEEVNRA